MSQCCKLNACLENAEPTVSLSIDQSAINLAAAVVLSSIIGFEREWHSRLAGVRTNTLVALGAATFVGFSDLVPGEGSPTRIAAQVVSGIGFLGAGLIFREGSTVRGLNTAATVWCSAGVGVLAGAGFLAAACVATAFVAFINFLLRPIVQVVNRQLLDASNAQVAYLVSATCHGSYEAHVRVLLLQRLAAPGWALQGLESINVDSTRVVVSAHLIANNRLDAVVENIVGHLGREPTICAVQWQVQTNRDARHETSAASKAGRPVVTAVELSHTRTGGFVDSAGADTALETATRQTDKVLLGRANLKLQRNSIP
jgi:putative Mg2+ transporter-C (MgtC) family protein